MFLCFYKDLFIYVLLLFFFWRNYFRKFNFRIQQASNWWSYLNESMFLVYQILHGSSLFLFFLMQYHVVFSCVLLFIFILILFVWFAKCGMTSFEISLLTNLFRYFFMLLKWSLMMDRLSLTLANHLYHLYNEAYVFLGFPIFRVNTRKYGAENILCLDIFS